MDFAEKMRIRNELLNMSEEELQKAYEEQRAQGHIPIGTTNPIETRRGSVLTAHTDVIGHQVNAKGVMGKGLVALIKKQYPEVSQQYDQFCKGQKELLGTCFLAQTYKGLMIANLFGSEKQQSDYGALRSALESCAQQMEEDGLGSIALPDYIGCGVDDGDPATVLQLIIDVFRDKPIQVEIWTKGNTNLKPATGLDIPLPF